MSATAHVNRIGTAVPPHEVHEAFVAFVAGTIADDRRRQLFLRMVARAGIERRFSFLEPVILPDGRVTDTEGFYGLDEWPGTADRMTRYAQWAPRLAGEAIAGLGLDRADRAAITHLIVASCTGFMAPGLDQLIVSENGLDAGVERTVVGFMGCYAAINALKLARHIVRSDPGAGVLMVNLELCTLHLQETQELEQVLSFLVFGDGAAASLITAREQGFALDSFKAVMVPETRGLITWKIRRLGFDMLLSGQVPAELGRALHQGELMAERDGVDLWAVHPGGRSILDAVEKGLELPKDALAASREVLSRYGNMSSATVMFVLERMMRQALPGQRGCAMSFGPGLTAETMRFHVV